MLDLRLVNLLKTFHLNQSDDALKLAAEVGRQARSPSAASSLTTTTLQLAMH
jgi:hypothetical protein